MKTQQHKCVYHRFTEEKTEVQIAYVACWYVVCLTTRFTLFPQDLGVSDYKEFTEYQTVTE